MVEKRWGAQQCLSLLASLYDVIPGRDTWNPSSSWFQGLHNTWNSSSPKTPGTSWWSTKTEKQNEKMKVTDESNKKRLSIRTKPGEQDKKWITWVAGLTSLELTHVGTSCPQVRFMRQISLHFNLSLTAGTSQWNTEQSEKWQRPVESQGRRLEEESGRRKENQKGPKKRHRTGTPASLWNLWPKVF